LPGLQLLVVPPAFVYLEVVAVPHAHPTRSAPFAAGPGEEDGGQVTDQQWPGHVTPGISQPEEVSITMQGVWSAGLGCCPVGVGDAVERELSRGLNVAEGTNLSGCRSFEEGEMATSFLHPLNPKTK